LRRGFVRAECRHRSAADGRSKRNQMLSVAVECFVLHAYRHPGPDRVGRASLCAECDVPEQPCVVS
jgi:hypothetical protein